MNKSQAQQLDLNDPLAEKRAEFCLNPGQIYLDGNSLGLLTKASRLRAKEVTVDQWGEGLITSWNTHHWIDLPVKIGEKIAPLIGAEPGQVICTDSVSVNLFKLLACALAMQPGRIKVLSQTDNFPTDLYITQGINALLGENRCQILLVEDEDIADAIDESVAVLLLTQVNFRSGKVHDMRQITELAHQSGALVIWDLAHSAGAIPVSLDCCEVDFAVGCGYKFLNGGPGAPAFIYAAKRHHQQIQQPLQGWMGHRSPFEFSPTYRPAEGIQSFLVGTPPVISMSILDAALDVFQDIDLCQLQEKSKALSEFFIGLITQYAQLSEFVMASPEQSEERGSQLSFHHPDAYAICQALIDEGVIADFRAPDILRFGITPLYTSFCDIWVAVERLVRVVEQGSYRRPEYQIKARVT